MSIYNWSLACSNVDSVYMTIYIYICDLKYFAIGIFELSHYTFLHTLGMVNMYTLVMNILDVS